MNYTNLIITFIISFVVIVAIETGLSKWKTNVVLKLLQHQQYDELEKELHNFITRAFIPRYNIEYLRLNSYLMQNKHEMIEKQFDELMKFRKNKNQQADLLMKAFNYYVEQENAEKSHFYLDEIQKLGNDKMYQEALMMSDQIRVCDGAKYTPVNRAEKGMVVAVTGLTHTCPGLGSSPWHATKEKLGLAGAGGVLSFDLEGAGTAEAWAFVDALKLHSNVANIGDVRSLVVHPATTTHSQSDEHGLTRAGISQATIRLAVGIENVDDIIADLEGAFAAVGK